MQPIGFTQHCDQIRESMRFFHRRAMVGCAWAIFWLLAAIFVAFTGAWPAMVAENQFKLICCVTVMILCLMLAYYNRLHVEIFRDHYLRHKKNLERLQKPAYQP